MQVSSRAVYFNQDINWWAPTLLWLNPSRTPSSTGFLLIRKAVRSNRTFNELLRSVQVEPGSATSLRSPLKRSLSGKRRMNCYNSHVEAEKNDQTKVLESILSSRVKKLTFNFMFGQGDLPHSNEGILTGARGVGYMQEGIQISKQNQLATDHLTLVF